MPETVRQIISKPINCLVRGRNILTATFEDGVYDCSVNCKLFSLNNNKRYKLSEFPEGTAQLNPVNQDTGTVCRTETCNNQGAIGFS